MKKSSRELRCLPVSEREDDGVVLTGNECEPVPKAVRDVLERGGAHSSVLRHAGNYDLRVPAERERERERA